MRTLSLKTANCKTSASCPFQDDRIIPVLMSSTVNCPDACPTAIQYPFELTQMERISPTEFNETYENQCLHESTINMVEEMITVGFPLHLELRYKRGQPGVDNFKSGIHRGSHQATTWGI